MRNFLTLGTFCGASVAGLSVLAVGAFSDPLPPDTTYRPLPTMPFSEARKIDEAQKPNVMQRQRDLLERRYDLSDRPMPAVMMSGGMKPVQVAYASNSHPVPHGTNWRR